jgi:hypothetical protein
VITPCGGGSGGGGIAWCQAANAAGYVAGDYAIGRSPNPLAYTAFSSTDATAFDFLLTNSPGAGDGDVRILRSGLYLVRLSVAPSALTTHALPAYNWDLALQARGQDAGGSIYFGMDFAPASAYYSGSAYGFFLSPRDNFVTAGYLAPNGNSMLGAGQAQAPETGVYLNLDDSVVDWPVTVYNRFTHGLNDADVVLSARTYTVLVLRMADSNPDAPTG